MEPQTDYNEMMARVRGHLESKYPAAVPIGDGMFFGEECLQKMEGSGRYCYAQVGERGISLFFFTLDDMPTHKNPTPTLLRRAFITGSVRFKVPFGDVDTVLPVILNANY